MDNIIFDTDSYKVAHWNMYPEGTETVYSYYESRQGAKYPYTLFFGLQDIIYALQERITSLSINDCAELFALHFGNNSFFNIDGWHQVREHNGRLPLSIKAVPEGTIVPTGNVLMTVENTDPKCAWLTNYVETLLSQVWYPCTVATLSHTVKSRIKYWLNYSSDNLSGLDFMLHDFGCRGVSSMESARIGGCAHLVNFKGTDTIPALLFAKQVYKEPCAGYSVAATEHSIMTSHGQDEEKLLGELLDKYPTGILSVVIDSYDPYRFIDTVVPKFKDKILSRDGKVVFRPDSTTKLHPQPGDQVAWIVKQLSHTFGRETNSKNFFVLNPKVGVLWGDGLEPSTIEEILKCVVSAGFSVESLVFGMGGGLLQKVNRDTQRFAFKCSAQKRNGEWLDIYKETLNKSSKKGRLKLVKSHNGYTTVSSSDSSFNVCQDELVEVFRDGQVLKTYTLQEIRERANENVR